MGRTRPLAIVLVIVIFIGVVLLALSAATAYRSFTVRAPNYRPVPRVRVYHCGSVFSPKNVQNLVSQKIDVPRNLGLAYKACEAARSRKSKRATEYLIAGAVLLITAFSIPAIRRAQRRRKHRPRKMYRV